MFQRMYQGRSRRPSPKKRLRRLQKVIQCVSFVPMMTSKRSALMYNPILYSYPLFLPHSLLSPLSLFSPRSSSSTPLLFPSPHHPCSSLLSAHSLCIGNCQRFNQIPKLLQHHSKSQHGFPQKEAEEKDKEGKSVVCTHATPLLQIQQLVVDCQI